VSGRLFKIDVIPPEIGTVKDKDGHLWDRVSEDGEWESVGPDGRLHGHLPEVDLIGYHGPVEEIGP
jgi:hypothetical protein